MTKRTVSQQGRSTKRRASRLSEGAAVRPLDYCLEYPRKTPSAEILAGLRATPERRLSVIKEKAPWSNRLYYGENLGLLRALLDDPQIRHKVTLVYIDPPFATGGVFESRNGQHAYEDLAYGAHYLEFLRQRLIVLRELMGSARSIYLHLDAKMAFAAKVLMDEIFGPANSRNWITRKKSNNKNYTRKQYGNISDYILFYTKTSEYVWNRPFDPWDEEHPPKEYQYIEENTGRRYRQPAGNNLPWFGMDHETPFRERN